MKSDLCSLDIRRSRNFIDLRFAVLENPLHSARSIGRLAFSGPAGRMRSACGQKDGIGFCIRQVGALIEKNPFPGSLEECAK